MIIKDWYNSLQAQEQKMVLAAAIVVGILLAYSILWAPLSSGLDNARNKSTTQTETLAWMQQANNQFQQLKKNNPNQAGSGKSLLTLVDENVRSSKLKGTLQRMEPEGTDAVKLWFKQTPFDDLVLLLGRLETNNGVRVNTATINPAEAVGLVDARMTVGTGIAQ